MFMDKVIALSALTIFLNLVATVQGTGATRVTALALPRWVGLPVILGVATPFHGTSRRKSTSHPLSIGLSGDNESSSSKSDDSSELHLGSGSDEGVRGPKGKSRKKMADKCDGQVVLYAS